MNDIPTDEENMCTGSDVDSNFADEIDPALACDGADHNDTMED